MYINVGAIDPADGARIPTKRALREALVSGDIAFDQTALVHASGLPGIIRPEDIKEQHQLSVVGPDPYTNRKWYATVQIGRDGQLKVTA
jgi:hypothetical protein